MRREVEDLRAFYASPLGGMVREAVGGRLAETWGDVRGLDVLALGYATPFVHGWGAARRVVAAMPDGQGVDPWPPSRNAAALVDEAALPFPSAFFDRVLMVHALEESDAPEAALAEAARVLGPAGRLICVAASRGGLWARAEATPFGHGRPYSRGQLERAVRAAGLEPQAWSRALYAPPLTALAGAAEMLEQTGRRLWRPLGGLVLLEAVKTVFAVRPKIRRAPARLHLAPVRLGGAVVSGHSI